MYIWLLKHHYCGYIRMYKCTSGCLNIIIVVIFECTNVHLAAVDSQPDVHYCGYIRMYTMYIWLYNSIIVYCYIVHVQITNLATIMLYNKHIMYWLYSNVQMYISSITTIMLYNNHYCVLCRYSARCTNVHLAAITTIIMYNKHTVYCRR